MNVLENKSSNKPFLLFINLSTVFDLEKSIKSNRKNEILTIELATNNTLYVFYVLMKYITINIKKILSCYCYDRCPNLIT